MSELVQAIAERALAYVLDPPAGDDPVVALAAPQDLVTVFGEAAGLALADIEEPSGDLALLRAVELVVQHSVHTSHPRFINQNFAGPDPVSVVGDWLGAALNTTGATFEAAPVFTLMESAVLSKLGRLAGYDDGATTEIPILPPGLFCPGGSTATLYALQLARHRRNPDVVTSGSSGERLTLFVSAAGHYAATKSAALLGIGTNAVIKVETDATGAMHVPALAAAVKASKQAGEVPFAVIATSGTTVTSAFDDIQSIADICEREHLWLHIDGCYGGSALFSATYAHLLDGVARSDSFVWNLHKMMGMTQQCTALLVKNPQQLAACFAGKADYLFQPDKLNAEYDSGDRTFQCARRIDVLKLWLSWKHHGDVGFGHRIDHSVLMADHARHRIRSSQGTFVPLVEGNFTNVVFAWIPEADRSIVRDGTELRSQSPELLHRLHSLPARIKAQMQAEGTAMIGFQPVDGLNAFRMLFMNPSVTTDDVDAMLALIDTYGQRVSVAT